MLVLFLHTTYKSKNSYRFLRFSAIFNQKVSMFGIIHLPLDCIPAKQAIVPSHNLSPSSAHNWTFRLTALAFYFGSLCSSFPCFSNLVITFFLYLPLNLSIHCSLIAHNPPLFFYCSLFFAV